MRLLKEKVIKEQIEFQNKTNMKFDVAIINNYIYLRFHIGSRFSMEEEIFKVKHDKNEILDKYSLKKYFDILNYTYNLSNKLIDIVNETEF